MRGHNHPKEDTLKNQYKGMAAPVGRHGVPSDPLRPPVPGMKRVLLSIVETPTVLPGAIGP